MLRIAIAFSYNILWVLKHKSKPLEATTLPNDSPAIKDGSFYIKSIIKVTVFTLHSHAHIVVSLIVCKYTYVR